MKTKIKITLGFTAEIILFVLTGIYLAHGRWGYALIALFFAMIVAGGVGKAIEKDAVDRFFGLHLKSKPGQKNWLRHITVEQITGAPRIPSSKKESFWRKFKL